jgi:carbon storage regulator CsrA
VLVISRRPDEKIVFPGLGIAVQFLGAKGRVIRLGINAPQDVKVFRAELLTEDLKTISQLSAAPGLSHAQRNTLNKLGLSLHLAERLLEAGQEEKARATLARAIATLGSMTEDERPAKREERPLRTLVVEDDTNERELLAGVLGMNGCEADTAADGQAALDYLASHDRPDFILLDFYMPRCDGRQALAQIRDNPLYSDMKVFAVSGASPRELGIDIGRPGFDAWFQKPLNPSQLWRGIQEQLQN